MGENKNYSAWTSLEVAVNNFSMGAKAVATMIFIAFAISWFAGWAIVEITHFDLHFSDAVSSMLANLNDALLHHEVDADTAAQRAELISLFSSRISTLLVFLVPFFFLTLSLVNDHFKAKTKKELEDNRFISGTKKLSEVDFKKAAKKFISTFKIGEIPYPKESETKHLLVVGAAGSGKTVLIRPAIFAAIQAEKKCMIHDIKGDFVEEFYCKERGHLIFNPLDERSVRWTIWNDIREESAFIDIKNFVSWAIPETPGAKDPFWVNSARGILEGIMLMIFENHHKNGGELTNEEIKKYTMMKSVDLAKELKEAGHNAASDYAAKQDSLSTFRANMAWVLFLPDGDFSVRQWIEVENGETLFIVNREDVREMMKPVLTLFINVAGSHILSMSEDLERRRYFFLDEFTSLSQLPKVLELLKLGRSKGCSVNLLLQDYQLLEKIYSEADMYTFVNNTASKAVLQLKEPKAAKYFSEFFGQYTFLESNRTISMGVAENRDGMSFNEQRKDEYVVKDTDILNLKSREAFIKIDSLPGIAKIKLAIPQIISMKSESYIQRKMTVEEQIRLSKALTAADKVAKATANKTREEAEEELKNIEI